MKARFLTLLLLLLAPLAYAQGLGELQTRAEATEYVETSRYADVVAFMEAVAEATPRIHVTTFGYSVEGRALPLAVVGDVMDASPEAVRASGKIPVYLQGNIHAGEVCGKEALLVLLREIAEGQHAALLDELVLLVAPIYNADGNERVSLYHRARQHGPFGGMGQRPNAQGLDLNRDHMKVESPEARSQLALIQAYDPLALMDLHTTNGSKHAYHLTYAPPLHPSTPEAIDTYLRETLLPEVTDRLREQTGFESYHYGNLPWAFGGTPTDQPRWATYSHQPRFSSNYWGIRGRLGILSEAYSYATFAERIAATHGFVLATLDHLAANPARVRKLTREVDPVGHSVALRADYGDTGTQTLLMSTVDTLANPYTGDVIYERTGERIPTPMPTHHAFDATLRTTVPAGYAILPGAHTQSVRSTLDAHGVQYRRLGAPKLASGDTFVTDTTYVARREFQGHMIRTLDGTFEPVRQLSLPVGTLIVPGDQPLGVLAALLLEPQSDDGLAAWNVFDDAVEEGGYPVVRLTQIP